MVVQEASINNIMGGLEGAEGVKLHTHRRKLKQRFDIIKKLGQGNYGKVQLGMNKETGQEVAIKTIKKAKIETEGDLIRIRREIQIMSSLRHPYIIHIYEVFENKDKIVLVMEYACGGELYDYLSQRKVLEDMEAQRLFRQIAMAVYYCHKHQICHRDLKLENILLDENGNAKLADFGLSNVFDTSRLLSTFCGSPLYASPEIVSGIPYYGPEVDCWSLGVLLYTLVYGAMPFDGSNFKRLVKQISHGEYYEPKTPSSASGLIRALLTVDGSERLDIVGVCSHTWLNSDDKETPCVKRALELSAEKPVRLDLLLSLNQPRVAVPEVQTKPSVVKSHSMGSMPSTKLPTPSVRKPVVQEENKGEVKMPKAEEVGSDHDRVPSEPVATEQPSDKAKKRIPRKVASPEPSLSSAGSSPTEPPPPREPLVVPQTPVKKPSKKLSKKPSKEPLIEETLTIELPQPPEPPGPSRQQTTLSQIEDSSPTTDTKNHLRLKLSEETVKPEETSHVQDSVTSESAAEMFDEPVSPISPVSNQDFKLASTLHLDKLIRSEIGTPVEPPKDLKLASNAHLSKLYRNETATPIEPISPLDRLKKESALKVISHAISESAMSGEKKSSTLPRRRLSRPEVTPPVAPAWRGAGPGTAPVASGNMVANTRTSQFVYPTPAPRTSLNKENKEDSGNSSPRERIIPIAVEGRDGAAPSGAAPCTPPPSLSIQSSSSAPASAPQTAHPLPRQSFRGASLSREGSDSGSSVSSVSTKGEAVRRSMREVIIPIAVEGGGYVTPPLRESIDEGSSGVGSSRELRGFGLASTRPPRSTVLDTQDSLSSDEDDDNFEILTAENLFSTLLSRVRSLTQRLNEDTGRATGFPRLFSHESVFDNPSWSRRRGLLGQHRLGMPSISRDSDDMLSRASSRLIEELPSRITSDDASFTSRPSRFSSATLPRARLTVHVPLVEKD